MKNKLFGCLLIVFLFTGIYLLFFSNNKIEMLEKRSAKSINDLSIDQLFDGSFVQNINDVLSDQMIERDELIKKYYSLKSIANSAFRNKSKLFKENNEIVSFDDEYLLANMYDNNFEDFSDNVKNKAYNLKMIAEKYPYISVYVYHPTRIEETTLLDSNNVYSNISNYENIFLSELGEKIKYIKLNINNTEDYKNYYYKTDQHWNAKGAYKGYSQIIRAIKEDYDVDSPREIFEGITIKKDNYGSYARKIGNSCDSERITDYKIDITTEYDYYINGTKSNDNDSKDYYINCNEDSPYTGYDNYFGANDFERIYDFNDDSKPNILIFADSFVNPIKSWIASHFNKTVILDMRIQPEDFSLDKYMKDYDIDIILYLQYYDSVYFNGYFFIPIN